MFYSINAFSECWNNVTEYSLIVFICIFAYCVLSTSWFPKVSSSIIFFLFSRSFGIVCCQQILLVIFPEGYFHWVLLLVWQFFSFNTWKILCHFILDSLVSDEKFVVIQMFLFLFFIGKVSFFFGCFRVFPFYSFSEFLLWFLLTCFFEFILFGVYSVSWICRFMSSWHIREVSSHYLF